MYFGVRKGFLFAFLHHRLLSENNVEGMNMIRKIACIVILGVSSVAYPVYADDVTEAINEAVTAYNDNDFAEAMSQLSYATQLVSQKKGEYLVSILPQPMDGWTSDEAENVSQGGVMGAGVQVSRQYTKTEGRASFQIEIIADSPMVASMAAMYSNPMLLTAGGAKIKKIKGKKAFVIEKRKKVEITIVAGSTLVKGSGRNVTGAEALAYIESLPIDTFK